MPTQLDCLSYQNSLSGNTLQTIYTFEYPWSAPNVYGVKTKITWTDSDLLRLEAEHYVSLYVEQYSSPNYPGYGVNLIPTPEGSTFEDNVYEQTWEYDIKTASTPTNYFAHLQIADEINVEDYFKFRIKLASSDVNNYNPDANLQLIFAVNSPNINGKFIIKSEILHAL